jgi:glycosyltransferase involved in cell wall biosynthesis
VERLGIPFLLKAPGAVVYWLRRRPRETARLWCTIPFRRWSSLEVAGENFWAFLCGFHLARRFLREDIRHLHAPWATGPATAAWVASRLTGLPFSFAARARDIYPPDGALAEKMRASSFIISETRTNVGHLARVAPDQAFKVHAIYNGLPLERYQPVLPALQPPYRLLALGRLVPKKGFDVLLLALKILREEGWDCRLTLAGSGPEEGRLKSLARDLGISPLVDFPGFILHHRIPELFQEADLLVMPSVVHASGDRDGIPTVIMEALAHRLPVVATDVSGIGEVIRHRDTGLVVPERDPAALARAIAQMLRDREGALQMAARGLALVRENFNPAHTCRQILQLYQDTFHRAGAAPRGQGG